MLEVLMGHNISNKRNYEKGPFQYWNVTAGSLKRQLETYSDYKRLINIDSLGAATNSEKKHILFTVDDGFVGFAENILPILEYYQIACIVFLTTGFVDSKLMPYELELFKIIESTDIIKTPKGPVNTAYSENKKSVYETLRLEYKAKNTFIRQNMLKTLRTINHIKKRSSISKLFLDWNDIKKLDRHPLVSFGAHTVSHPLLPNISLIQAFREIWESKNRIESCIGHKINCFSYPYGGHSFLIRTMVRLVGIKYAFTTEQKIVTQTGLNYMAIPRIDLKNILIKSNANG